MGRDILFKTEDLVFSYRVGGLLYSGGKVLLQKPKNDDYAVIGGHVSALESTAETLVREYKEELHVNIEVEDLLAVGEIFFPWGNRPCHQICLYYKVRLAEGETLPAGEVFHGWDELDNERIDLDFCWVPAEDVPELVVYPLELRPYIAAPPVHPVHFVSRQLD